MALKDEGIWDSEMERETIELLWEICDYGASGVDSDLCFEFHASETKRVRPVVIMGILAGWLTQLLDTTNERSVTIDHDANVLFECNQNAQLGEFRWIQEATESWNKHARSGLEW